MSAFTLKIANFVEARKLQNREFKPKLDASHSKKGALGNRGISSLPAHPIPLPRFFIAENQILTYSDFLWSLTPGLIVPGLAQRPKTRSLAMFKDQNFTGSSSGLRIVGFESFHLKKNMDYSFEIYPPKEGGGA